MAFRIEVTVVSCRGVKGHDWFSETDPYVVVKLGAQQHKTRVEKDAGPDANFHETFTFRLSGPLEHWSKESLEVRVLDKDFIFDQLMGQQSLSLGEVLKSFREGPWFGDVELQDKKGRSNGAVTLSICAKES